MEDVDKAEDEDGSHVHGQGDQEHEEVSVVAATDAVVNPRAMVVKHLDKRKRLHSTPHFTGIRTPSMLTSMQLLHTEQCEHLGGR